MNSAVEPNFSRGPIAVLLSIVFLGAMGTGIIMPLLPFYAIAFVAPPWQLTLLFATFSLGQFVGELFWGRASDMIGRRRVILVTTLCAVFCYAAFAYAPDIWLAMAARAAGGFFSGNLSTAQGYVGDRSPPVCIAGRLSLIAAAFSSGYVIGPLLGGLLVRPDHGLAGFRLPLMTCAVMSALAFAGTLAFVPAAAPRAAASIPLSHFPRIRKTRVPLDSIVLRLLVTTMVGYGAWSAMVSTLGLWGHERFAWNPREIGAIIALSGTAAAVSQSLLSRVSVRRFGEAPTVAGALLLTSMCLVVQAYSPWQLLAVVALLLAAVGHMGAQPCTTSLISECAPPLHRGTLLGANVAVGALGRVTGPLIAGALFSIVGSRGPLLFAAAGLLPAAALAASAARCVRLRQES
jgi:MFS transporter, DHA1 family, tetracycline resistance protein